MRTLSLLLSATYFLLPLIFYFTHATTALGAGGGDSGGPVPVSDGPTVRKDERWPLVSTEFGEISAVQISDGRNGSYHLHFITMEPHSLFLPVHLYSEMVFYVNSGGGTLSWIGIYKDDNKLQKVKLQKGDVYRLQPDTVFYIENNLQTYPEKLQIYAIFPATTTVLHNEKFARLYVSIHDLVLGFDKKVLQSALSVPQEVIENLRGGEKQQLIVQGLPKVTYSVKEVGSLVIRGFLGTKDNDIFNVENNRKPYNIGKVNHDVESRYGWSVTATKKKSDVMKDTDFSVSVVNLTKGAMMGPHWNARSAEVAIVLRGQGVVNVVCPTITNKTVCTNSRFKVTEGDVFMVPRYHPMAQISFNNGSFVFMGFGLASKDNPTKYLAGKLSILRTLDKMVLAKSFNVNNVIIDQVLWAKSESIMLDCTSCAEDVQRLIGEESGEETKGGGGGSEGQQKEKREGEIPSKEDEEETGKKGGQKRGGGKGQETEKGDIPKMEEEKKSGKEKEGRGKSGGGGQKEEEREGEIPSGQKEQEEAGRKEEERGGHGGWQQEEKKEEDIPSSEKEGEVEKEKEGGGGGKEAKKEGDTPKKESGEETKGEGGSGEKREGKIPSKEEEEDTRKKGEEKEGDIPKMDEEKESGKEKEGRGKGGGGGGQKEEEKEGEIPSEEKEQEEAGSKKEGRGGHGGGKQEGKKEEEIPSSEKEEEVEKEKEGGRGGGQDTKKEGDPPEIKEKEEYESERESKGGGIPRREKESESERDMEGSGGSGSDGRQKEEKEGEIPSKEERDEPKREKEGEWEGSSGQQEPKKEGETPRKEEEEKYDKERKGKEGGRGGGKDTKKEGDVPRGDGKEKSKKEIEGGGRYEEGRHSVEMEGEIARIAEEELEKRLEEAEQVVTRAKEAAAEGGRGGSNYHEEI